MKANSKQKKRVSKRNKIAWRKHVDITDVEDFLDDQRFEEILGTAQKPDDELFVIDTTLAKTPPSSLSTRERRKLKSQQPPKCYSALLPQSKVPDPMIKRNRLRTIEERQKTVIVTKGIKKRLDGKLARKAAEKAQSKLMKQQAFDKKDSKHNFILDLWESDLTQFGNTSKIDVRDDEWISGDTERHLMHGVGKRKKIVPKTIGTKPNNSSSIELPHPGMSYNPTFKDHQELLTSIVEKERVIIKEEKHIDRVTRQMFRKVPIGQRETSWFVEMSQGIPSLDPSVANVEESVGEYKANNPPVENRRKTLKQRRKQKEEQKIKLARKVRLLEKKKVTDMHRLRFIGKHMQKLGEKSEKKAVKKVKKAEEDKTKVKRLGRTKFVEPELAFNMARDIAGNLRNIKREGNLLADRWSSLQKRNLIEPTAARIGKRGKVKKFTRVGHKEDWKESIAKPRSQWTTARIPTVKPKGNKNKRRPKK